MKKAIKRFFNYLRPSWEGDDGYVSYKRSAQFVFVLLIITAIKRFEFANIYQVYALLILCLTFLLLAMVISFTQIVDALRAMGQFKNLFTSNSAVEETPKPE